MLDDLADYAVSNAPLADAARRTACLCLTDALACAVGAAEQKPPLLGSLFGDVGVGTTRVLGTALAADPVKAATAVRASTNFFMFHSSAKCSDSIA